MSTVQKSAGTPSNGYIQPTNPPGTPHPNTQSLPVPLQWNVSPVPTRLDGYQGTSVWTPPLNTFQQWNIQPGSYIITAPAPQDIQQTTLYQTFLKGKPHTLGIVIIVSAIIKIILGIILCFVLAGFTVYSGIFLWGPIFHIIAGSLTIAAYKNASVCKVKGSLTMNILSSIICVIATILSSLDIAFAGCESCYYTAGKVVLYFFCVINLVIFCICVSVSTTGCRALDQLLPAIPSVFLIQNNAMASGLLSYPTSEVPTNLPPPYAAQ